MKELKIIVVGTTGAGKSTVAELIARALERAGVTVDVIDEGTRCNQDSYEQLRDRTKVCATALAGPIRIETLQSKSKK